MFRGLFGDERKPETDPAFMYILHHQLADAAHAYGADTPAAMRVLFSAQLGTVRGFRQKFTLEGAIGSHACSLQALTCV
jgi:hypothetical protein